MENVGQKLKVVSIIALIVGVILSLYLGVNYIKDGLKTVNALEEQPLLGNIDASVTRTEIYAAGIALILIGWFVSYVNFLLLYGVGLMLLKTQFIIKMNQDISISIQKLNKKMEVNNSSSISSKVNSANNLKDQALQNSNGKTDTIGNIECVSMYELRNFKGKRLILPNSVVKIATFAFSECKGLEILIIPNSVQKIEKYAFAGCKNLTIFIDIDKNTFTDIEELNQNNCVFYWKGEWQYNQSGDPVSI